MSTRERVYLLLKVREKENLSFCLSALQIPRSSYYYYQKRGISSKDCYQLKYKGLKRKIEKIILRHPGYGYRRIQQELLRKYQVKINHKPLKILLKLWHLEKTRKVKKTKPSSLKEYIKKLGAKVNLVKQIANPKPFQIVLTEPFLLLRKVSRIILT